VKSRSGGFPRDCSLAREAVLGVAIKMDLPVGTRSPHLLPENHETIEGNDGIRIAVENEDPRLDLSRLSGEGRTQITMDADDAAQGFARTSEFQHAAAAKTVTYGRHVVAVAFGLISHRLQTGGEPAAERFSINHER
jgi:hypothetical protein